MRSQESPVHLYQDDFLLRLIAWWDHAVPKRLLVEVVLFQDHHCSFFLHTTVQGEVVIGLVQDGLQSIGCPTVGEPRGQGDRLLVDPRARMVPGARPST